MDHVRPSSLAHIEIGDAFATQANTLFFTSFPAEIRRKILVEAFGDRLLHVVRLEPPYLDGFHWAGGECEDIFMMAHMVRSRRLVSSWRS